MRTSRPNLRDLLFIGFCAVLIVMFRVAFRWRLGITGHSMFYTIALLLLARGCVSFRWGATFAGTLSGTIALILGLGKGGPLILAKFLFPAIVIDLGAMVFPTMFASPVLIFLVAALASATKILNVILMDLLVRMDTTLVLQHALIEGAVAVAFGVLGSLLVPPVLKKLKARGIIPTP